MTRPDRNPSVLVIDDQRFQRRMLVRLLMECGVGEIFEATDGRSAQKILETCGERLSLIVSDVDMPSMDGLEFLRWLAGAAPRTPVAIHSALNRSLLESVETMAGEYGVTVVGVIEKPATEAILRQIIARARTHRVERGSACETEATPAEVAAALEGNELEPWFQPQIDVRTGEILGAEALARWRRPDGVVLAPASFMPALAASRLMRPFTVQIAAKALHGLSPGRTISLNVCPTLLDDPSFGEELHSVIAGGGGCSEQVVLEVTESAATQNRGAWLENLTRLRMRGFSLSIDDFGTGFSSLTQLVRTPFTELKIDRSFIAWLEPGHRERLLVESTIALAQRLGLRTVAEGVETAEQLAVLRELGCQVAQGYLFARPLPLTKWIEWRAHASRRATGDYRAQFLTKG